MVSQDVKYRTVTSLQKNEGIINHLIPFNLMAREKYPESTEDT